MDLYGQVFPQAWDDIVSLNEFSVSFSLSYPETQLFRYLCFW